MKYQIWLGVVLASSTAALGLLWSEGGLDAATAIATVG